MEKLSKKLFYLICNANVFISAIFKFQITTKKILTININIITIIVEKNR